jgi:hypothetical protein
MSRQPREDAYGPSPIASSTRSTKQIDLWMDVVRIEAMQFAQDNSHPSWDAIKVDRWRLSV